MVLGMVEETSCGCYDEIGSIIKVSALLSETRPSKDSTPLEAIDVLGQGHEHRVALDGQFTRRLEH